MQRTQRFDLFVFRYGVRSTRLRGALPGGRRWGRTCRLDAVRHGRVGSSHLDDDVAAPAGGAARVNPAP